MTAILRKIKIAIDLKTKVYKELLKWCRENLNDSSQSEETSNSNEVLNSDLDFEFRDHSPIDKNIKHFNTKLNYEFEYNQENIRNDQIDKLNENKTKLPDLKFENTADNISINNKEKPPIAKKKNSNIRKSTEKPLHNELECSRNSKVKVSTSETLEYDAGGRFTPNFKSRESQKAIQNLSPQMPSCFERVDRHSCLSTTNDKESFDLRQKNSESRTGNRFSDLMNSYDTESSEEQPRENAVDSNDRVASCYFKRRLKLKAWKSLLLGKMIKMHSEVMRKLALSHDNQRVLEKALRSLIINTEVERSDKQESSRGDKIFRVNSLKRFFNVWRSEFRESISEETKLKEVQDKLDYKRKLVLMRKWKEQILFSHVRKAQINTAIFIHKKKLMKKTIEGFKLCYNEEKCNKLRMIQAIKFEKVKLLTTAFKILHWYKNKKKLLHETNLRIEAAYNRLAKRRGFVLFRKNCNYFRRQKQVNECARKFHIHQVTRKYFDVIKTYTKIQSGMKNQKYCIENYHKERTTLKIIFALKSYTKEKKEYRSNALLFKHRCYQRKLMFLWKTEISKTIVRNQPQKKIFYYASYIWMQRTFNEKSDQSLQMIPNKHLQSLYFPNHLPISTKKKYSEFYAESNKKLTQYIVEKIFESWKSQLNKIKATINKRKDRKLKEIINFWKQYADLRMIQRAKLNELQVHHNFYTISTTFDKMKEYLKMKVELKKRLKIFSSCSELKIQKKFMLEWRIQYKKKIIRTEQDMVATQMYKKTFLKYFSVWKHKYFKYKQLNEEDEKLKNFHESSLLRNCWNAIVQYKNDRKWKKSALIAADQERSYWLAQNAFQGWAGQINKFKQRNSLYKLLNSHYEFSLKKQALFSLKSVVNFKIEQRYNDLIAINEIVEIRQRNIILQWHRVTVKRQATKIIGFQCQKAIKCIILRDMINRYKYQNSVIYYMQSQRQYYINLTAFNRLKQASRKRKMINEGNEIVENRKEYWIAKKAFMTWLNKYRALKKVYTTYAFLAVQIKNSITKECFECFKLFAKCQKNKRIALQFYEKNQKQKLLNTMYNRQTFSSKNYNASSLIIQKQNYKTKSKVLSLWRSLFKTVNSQRQKVESFYQTKWNLKQQQIIIKWRSLTKSFLHIKQCRFNLETIVNKRRINQGMCMFINGIEKLKEQRLKQEKADNFYSIVTLRKVKNAWCQRAFENKAETSKIVQIRNMIKRKNVLKCWEVMLNSTHEKRMKIRYIRYVTKLPHIIEYRLAFMKWSKFVQKEQILDEKINQGWEYFKQKRLAIALNKLLEHYIERKELREEIQEYKLRQLEKIVSFRAVKLSNKAMNAWKRYMSDNYELFIKRKALIKRQRERKLPFALMKWINYANLKNAYAKRSNKAVGFLSTNLINKSMKALDKNRIERRGFRILYNQACIYHCENLVYKGFTALKDYYIYRVENKSKREIFTAKMIKLDTEIRMKKVLNSLIKYNIDSNETLEYFKDILKKKKKQRLFNSLRYFKNKNLDLKVRYEALKDATEKRIKHSFILRWVKEYDNQWVIKELKLKQELKIKSLWFSELKHEYIINKACNHHISHKNRETTACCFKVFIENVEFQKYKRMQIESAEKWHLKDIKLRIFEGFKFNLLIAKSIELLKTKRLHNYKVRAFGSLKWQWLIKNMQLDFNKTVEKRALKDHFYGWYEATYNSKNREVLLYNILCKKHHYAQLESFGIWKRDSFFKTMVTIIDQVVIQPDNASLIQNVFYSWRRAHEFEKVREYCENLADENHSYNLTSKMFKAWKVAAEPDMKKYLKMKRALNVITNIMITKPFYQLISISEKEKVKEDKAFYFLKQKQFDYLSKVYTKWRKVIAEQKFESIKIKHINQHFKTLSNTIDPNLHEKESEITFDENKIKKIAPDFKLPAKLQIQTTCIRLFQSCTETTNIVLMQKYINALKYNCRQQKIRREQFEYSAVYYCQCIKRKYIRRLVESYNNAVDYKHNEIKAIDHYSEKSLKQLWVAFVEGIENSKLEKAFEVNHNRRLKSKVFNALVENIKMNNKKKKLNNTMIQLMKERNKYIIKHTYLTWRNHFELESYYKKAISEFSEYRKTRLMKGTLKAMSIQIKKEKHLKELEKRATDYFSKRAELRLMKTAFTAFHRNAQKEILTKTGKADEMAENHYLIIMGGKIFKEWKQQTIEQRKKDTMDRKYAIFYAWKFFAKQNSLVKKYLKECDFSSSNTGEGSLKCTMKSPQPEFARRLSRESPDECLNPTELKENKGYMSMNHPNVISNFQSNKYY